MINNIYTKSYIKFNYSRSLIRFINNVIVNSTTINLERINVTILIKQDSEIINVRVKLYI